MLSLVLTVFFVHLAIYLVNTVGASTIDNLVWLLYLRLPTPTARTARKQQKLKRQVLEQKREMNSTSSQDEFAKWAKARRRHDKTLEEYEALNKALTSHKSSFDWAVKIARWLSTNGLKIFLQFWYSKTPVFPLPEDWFPYYVQWIVSFPRAPLGSVSIQVWSNVCATAIAVAAEVIGAMLVQVMGQKEQKKQATPVGAGMGKAQ
ncbi:CHD5-like protein [Penicillium bovifimosum]|uniref:CHD5-like protein n=1 Tax=Penicillium bovifimosum TaxID=126998 RepID=A0A9W9L9N5_9EURO|nr:CHD5-like protein [Penicillium bovifimosum]KAJ5144078.1 CHD5-like protein [Penicillium bovifimosum]